MKKLSAGAQSVSETEGARCWHEASIALKCAEHTVCISKGCTVMDV